MIKVVETQIVRHEGYRQRAINHFLKEGLDSMDDIHALELLLFFAIPHESTTLLAHELLDEFGNLEHVMESTEEELEKVPGMNKQAATLIVLTNAISRYCMIEHSEKIKPLTNVDACAKYLMPYFHGCRDEMVFLLCLDGKGRVICCRKVGQGTVNSAGVSIRNIVEIALDVNATTVVLAHNHPGGEAIPSGSDIVTTNRLAQILDTVSIQLADHIVVAGNDYVSMAKYGYYRPEEACAKV